MIWLTHDPDCLGFLPLLLSEDDPRPAREQLDANYAHGGGWRPMDGWTREGMTIMYPGDPPLQPIAMTMLRDEGIALYPHDFLMIVQPDKSFEVARVD